MKKIRLCTVGDSYIVVDSLTYAGNFRNNKK